MNALADTRGHSKWAPSAAKRWMECAASVREAENAPSAPPSIWALKGSSVAKIAELCLTHDQDPEEFVGRSVLGQEFSVEDVEPLRVYLTYIRKLGEDPEAVVIPEARLAADALWPGLFGHADCVVVHAPRLHVVDLKFGEGVRVDEIMNPQLLIYALAAHQQYDRSDAPLDKIEMTVVQPRYANGTDPVRTFAIHVSALYQWGVVKLLPALRRTIDVNAQYHTGDWCRFCPARATCPALRDVALQDATHDFEAVSSLTPADLSKILDHATIVESWIEAVRAEAFSRAQRGIIIPGYILGVGRTTREWTDEAQVPARLRQDFNLPQEDIYETRLRSPAQIEKRLPPMLRPKLRELITPKASGPKLVKNDGRMPVQPLVANDFVPDFLQ